MRYIYLIRHGEGENPTGEKYCIGRTDIPISPLGKLQGCLLGEYFAHINLTAVYSSPLLRAKCTADFIITPQIVENLTEHYMGTWDGLSFAEIALRYPELYALRQHDKTLMPPKAESIRAAADRFAGAVFDILEKTQENIAIVSHSTVIRGFLCPVMGIPLENFRNIDLPRGSVTKLIYDNGKFIVEYTGSLPRPELNEELCIKLHKALGNGDNIINHCKAVADKALITAQKLINSGVNLDSNLIYTSSLLHDIARKEKNHPEKGGAWLIRLGYEDIGNIIKAHERLEFEKIDERSVLYIADKCIIETGKVTVEDRFAKSLSKCLTDEAKEAHREKLATALKIKSAINNICREDVII